MAEAPRSARLLRSSAVMAAGTVASRLSGFARAAAIAAALGTLATADVFTIANTIPNSLYILVAGGVLNSVLVPQLVRAMRSDADSGEAYAQRLFSAVTYVLLVATVLAVLLAEPILRVYTDAVWRTPPLREQYDAMVALARFCLPQIFFYGLYVVLGQMLNARDRFGPMMWAPVLNNVVAVAVFGTYLAVKGQKAEGSPWQPWEVALLGLGSTLGIVAQAVVLLPVLHRAGLTPRLRRDLRGHGLGKAGRLGGWTVAFVVLNQLVYLVVVNLASGASGAALASGSADGGGYTVYSFAFLLLLVPHAVVTVSLATAMLPSLSRTAAAGDLPGVRGDLLRTLRTAWTVMVPAAALLGVLATPVAQLVFGYGASAETAPLVGQALAAFAPGLVAFTAHYIVLRGYYALEDTRTPFLVQLSIAVTNVGLALGGTAALGDRVAVPVVLAGSWSAAYLVGALVSGMVLRRRLRGRGVGPLLGLLARTSAAAVGAAAAARAVQGWAADAIGAGGLTGAAALLLGLLVAVPVYLALARLLRLHEVGELLAALGGAPGRRLAGYVSARPRRATGDTDRPPTMGPDGPR